MPLNAAHLDRSIDDVVAHTNIPAVSLCIVQQGEIRYTRSVGLANRSTGRPIGGNPVFDLASVTKVVGTVPLAACLIRNRRLDLDTSVNRWIAGLPDSVRVHHLLSHSSGAAAWSPMYAKVSVPGSAQAREEILTTAATHPRPGQPGVDHTYSDLGYLMLCRVLESAGGDRLDHLLRQEVLEPLGIQGLSWGAEGACATEDCPVRGRIIEGEVHDLNAWAMGGVSTHAGLFGSARTVAMATDALRAAISGEPSPLPSDVMRHMAQTPGAGSHRLGFDGVSAGYTSTGEFFPPDTVGHLGYTGTSAWIVPSRNTTVVLLTNRVHPRDDLSEIRVIRPQIHDAVAHALQWDTASP